MGENGITRGQDYLVPAEPGAVLALPPLTSDVQSPQGTNLLKATARGTQHQCAKARKALAPTVL